MKKLLVAYTETISYKAMNILSRIPCLGRKFLHLIESLGGHLTCQILLTFRN